MGYAYLSNSKTNRKQGKNNEIYDTEGLLRVITVVENTAVKKGDFSVGVPFDGTDIVGKIYDVLNDVIELNKTKSVCEKI